MTKLCCKIYFLKELININYENNEIIEKLLEYYLMLYEIAKENITN